MFETCQCHLNTFESLLAEGPCYVENEMKIKEAVFKNIGVFSHFGITGRDNTREGFALAHSFRKFISHLLGPMLLEKNIMNLGRSAVGHG